MPIPDSKVQSELPLRVLSFVEWSGEGGGQKGTPGFFCVILYLCELLKCLTSLCMNFYDGDGVGRRKKNQHQDVRSYPNVSSRLTYYTFNLTEGVNQRFILISELLTHKETCLTELM